MKGDTEIYKDEQDDLAELKDLGLGHGCTFEEWRCMGWSEVKLCGQLWRLVCGPMPRLIARGLKCGDRVYNNASEAALSI
jgi:hypothetical protein